MALKSFVKSLSDVDEKFKSLYEEVEGGFSLQIDDKDYKDRLDEFRGNNISLKKQIEKLTAAAEKFKNVDTEKYEEMQSKLDGLQDKELLDAGKLDELLEQRTERMKQDNEAQIAQLTERADKAEKLSTSLKLNLDTIKVNDEVSKTVMNTGIVKKGAMTDVLSRAAGVWKVGESGLEARGFDGNLMYGKDGKEALTLKEWVEGLQKEADYLFEPNTGGGAPGSNNQGGAGMKVIDFSDKAAFSSNLADIATGKVSVNSNG